MTENEAIAVVLSCVFLVCLMSRQRKGGRDLDRVLLRWTKQDRFTMRDLLNGGLLVLGITGSGKTSSSSRKLAIALVRDRKTFGCLLCAKPEDLGFWKDIFRRCRQSHRLQVFDGQSSKLRINVLEQCCRSGDTRDVTRLIMVGRDALRNAERGRGTENASFFEQQEQMLVHHAVEIVKQAKGTVSAYDLQQFIATAAQTRDDINDPEWQRRFHNQCIGEALAKKSAKRQQHDLMQAIDFWLGTFPPMDPRTRSNILAGVTGMLFVFCNGAVHELLGTTTNFSFEQLERKRQWLLVNLPPSHYGDSGTLIGSLLKYQMQRYVLRRKARAGDPVNVIWCDEAQQWTGGAMGGRVDAEYIAQCRSHRGCLIFITQGLESFPSTMRGEGGKQETMALLQNFSTKIVHTLGSVDTAQWLSSMLGQRLEHHFGGSSKPADSILDGLLGNNESSSSFSEQYAPVLQPGVFLTGLTRTGGPQNRFLCDAIVMRAGRPFSHGENWMHVTFSQR